MRDRIRVIIPEKLMEERMPQPDELDGALRTGEDVQSSIRG